MSRYCDHITHKHICKKANRNAYTQASKGGEWTLRHLFFCYIIYMVEYSRYSPKDCKLLFHEDFNNAKHVILTSVLDWLKEILKYLLP